MTMIVTAQQSGRIAVLTINRPPVNAINADLRRDLIQQIEQAEKDSAIEAIVLVGAGKSFISGADLKEFDSGIVTPGYSEMTAAIEGYAKPVIASLHGMTLGGGVEVAVACHYRCATPDANLGMPEITLGVVPGAGGTQRLPRLIGPKATLELLFSGAPVNAEHALSLGLVDKIATADPVENGVAYAEELLEAGCGPRPTSKEGADFSDCSDDDVAALLKKYAKPLKGRTTQQAMISAVRAARQSLDHGLAEEKKQSDASLASVESRALRHVFFAERNAAVIPGMPDGVSAKPVERVAVIGAGTMGSGIAIAFANAGFDVTLVDAREEGLERGRNIIRGAYGADVKRGRLTQEQAEAKADAITTVLGIDGACGADLVVEAVFEDMDVKKSVLAELDKTVGPDTIIASNTSSLSVTELGASTSRPDKVIGLHFFSPAHIMKLLEIVRGDDTSYETMATGVAVGRRIRKIPVISGDGFGFIGNRMMLDGNFREAEMMMMEGAALDRIDRVVEKFGFAMGPSRVSDMAGVDISALVRQQLLLRESRPAPYLVIAQALTEIGRTGQKSGKGFYSYADDPRRGAIDEEAADVIRRLANEHDVVPRELTDEEIEERFVLPLINVGANILADGIAYRAADIDVVWTSGYGFPRYRGGPMFYADTLGLDRVLDRIRHYQSLYGHYWTPSPLLEELAAAGKTFAELDRSR